MKKDEIKLLVSNPIGYMNDTNVIEDIIKKVGKTHSKVIDAFLRTIYTCAMSKGLDLTKLVLVTQLDGFKIKYYFEYNGKVVK